MEPLLAAAAAWLDAIGLGPWARGSGNVYPVANTLHLLGLVLLVGGIGVVDLRIAGAWKALPLGPLARALTPLASAGLLVLAASGTVLFAADGASLARSGTFQLKLALILAAIANALLFRWRWPRRTEPGAPVLALVSLALWLSVATAGRMIAYS